MHKFFVTSFIVVLTLYILTLSMTRYAGVYVHYFMIPLIVILLLLSFLTKPGLFSKTRRTERTLQDDDYGFFDLLLDSYRAVVFIIKIPFEIVKYIKQDYRESQSRNKPKK